MKIALVLLQDRTMPPLDYYLPASINAKSGDFLLVPLGKETQKGLLLKIKDSSDIPSSKMKSAIALLDTVPPLPYDLLQMGLWIHRYYGTTLEHAFLPILRGKPRKKPTGLTKKSILLPVGSSSMLANLCASWRQTAAEKARVIEVLLKEPDGISFEALLQKSGATRPAIEALVKQEYLRIKVPTAIMVRQEKSLERPKVLNKEQANALQAILASIAGEHFSPHLLFGVTGSGKTEIYLQAIEAARATGKGTLFLVPEIALTQQTIHRLVARLGSDIAILHSKIPFTERAKTWRAISEGAIQVVIGTRSAIFAPIKNLSLVVVDEEHDSSYKQSEILPLYHGRDMAVLRAKLNNATIVLGSATPSVESYAKAKKAEYQLHRLTQRANNATLPQITTVFHPYRNNALSDKLLEKIKKRLETKEQCLLLLNRRGYHAIYRCSSCQAVACCTQCTRSLTFHRAENLLLCHLCGYHSTPEKRCNSCKKNYMMEFKGIGTQWVEKAITKLFPQAKIARLDADTSRKKGEQDSLLESFANHEIDIMIGTQMLAKGHHFPEVTLVAVLEADFGLYIPDFRSSEHLLQYLLQVSGRAGRASLQGEVLLQTSITAHPLLTRVIDQDYLGFLEEEIALRKKFQLPPFIRLIKITFSNEKQELSKATAESWRETLIQALPLGYTIYPVIPAQTLQVKSQFRFQCLVKGKDPRVVVLAITKIQEKTPDRSTTVIIDVDPIYTS